MKDFLGNTVEVGDYMLDAYNCRHISKLRVIQVEHCLSDMYPDRPDLSDFCEIITPEGRCESYHTYYGYRLPKEDALLYLLQRNTK